jgi:hypothetical protein
MIRNADEDRKREVELVDLDAEVEQVDAESGTQSGDTQGLPAKSEASDESVVELVKEGQAFEAGFVEGVEEAEKNPGRPVQSHEDPRPVHESELPRDPDWK